MRTQVLHKRVTERQFWTISYAEELGLDETITLSTWSSPTIDELVNAAAPYAPQLNSPLVTVWVLPGGTTGAHDVINTYTTSLGRILVQRYQIQIET